METWRRIKDTFEPNTVPVWLDDSVIDLARRWTLGEGSSNGTPGIVWTEHQAFAKRLAQESRLSYYGRQGRTEEGRPIELADPSQSLIASLQSNAEGRNLQSWSRNLIVSCPPNGAQWEQPLGRTHRDGQQADEVTFDVVITCHEHESALTQALADARYIEASTGQAQKLLYADCLVPLP